MAGARRVSHRATGTFLGWVGQHYGGGELNGWWTAWNPYFNDGLGEASETMYEAADMLVDAHYNQPVFYRRKCHGCTYVIRWNAKPCDLCETEEQAEARSRSEHPKAWQHYDWLCSLKEIPNS